MTVTASGNLFEGLSELMLQYQIVEPGHYVALKDRAYARGWTTIPMARIDKKEAEISYSAQLPATVQTNRRLVRYRIASKGQIVS